LDDIDLNRFDLLTFPISIIKSNVNAMHKFLQRQNNERKIQQIIKPTRWLECNHNKIMESKITIQWWKQ